MVKEKLPAKTTPVPGAPAVAQIKVEEPEEAKTEEIKDDAEEETTSEAKIFWKFAVKACHLKAIILAYCMEYAKPKRMMFEFAEPVLVMILKKFLPEVYTDEENRNDGVPTGLSEKVLPDHYYSFQHRLVYAKLRRMGYFVVESERLHRQLLHDELRYYELYDFGPNEVEEKEEEVKELTAAEKLAKNKEAAINADKIAAAEIIKKFGIEYT